MAGRNKFARLAGDQGFEGRQRMVLAAGITLEFSSRDNLDEAEEGTGLELESVEFHTYPQ